MFSLSEWFGGELIESDEEPAESATGGEDLGGLEEDLGGDGLGGLEEDLGGDESEGLDDDIDGFDDDPFGESGDEGSSAELEKTVEDLEEEVASLSSTVNTVRSENEEISDTVLEVEENVRKLLDIYEMVTRGVNPFVDEAAGIAGDAGGVELDGGDFDLFDGEDETDEDLNEEVADADAEDFFDEDFAEPGEPDAGDAGDSLGDGASSGDGETLDTGTDDEMTADGAVEDGTSFDELKEKYESGEADWAEDEFDGAGGDGSAGDAAEETESAEFTDEPADDPSVDGVLDGSGELPEQAGSNGQTANHGGDPSSSEVAMDVEQDQNRSTASEAVPDQRAGRGGEVTKPYLRRLDGGYETEFVVMEWLEFLVETSDLAEAARAIDYYETIDWITTDVADALRKYLRGFGEAAEVAAAGDAPSELAIEEHTESLRYVSRLDGTDVEPPFEDNADT